MNGGARRKLLCDWRRDALPTSRAARPLEFRNLCGFKLARHGVVGGPSFGVFLESIESQTIHVGATASTRPPRYPDAFQHALIDSVPIHGLAGLVKTYLLPDAVLVGRTDKMRAVAGERDLETWRTSG